MALAVRLSLKLIFLPSGIFFKGSSITAYPLTTRLGDVSWVRDEADALHDVPQLSVRVHRLRDAIDVSQRQLALLLDAAMDDAHVTGDQPDLSADVRDLADLRGLRVWADVGRRPVRDSLDVHRVPLVVGLDDVAGLKCNRLENHMTAGRQARLDADAGRRVLKVQFLAVHLVQD